MDDKVKSVELVVVSGRDRSVGIPSLDEIEFIKECFNIENITIVSDTGRRYNGGGLNER